MDWNSEMGGVALALAALAKALASTGALTPEAFTASCADATAALAASKEMDKAKETFASVVNAIAADIAQEKAEQASGKEANTAVVVIATSGGAGQSSR